MVDTEGLDYYLVGGAVRDKLACREPNDEDYVVVGATPEEMDERGFGKMVGEEFPVFLHPETKDEWALARTERKTGVGYKGFEVYAEPDVTLEEDLERRDLTINSLAMNPETGEVIDPFGGQEDLDAGIVRHVSEAFAEDPLRVLRAARFAGRFDFEVAEETRALMQEVAPELESVDPERIDEELRKALKQAERPRKVFDVLLDVGALDIVLPELAALDEVPAGPEEFHGEGSAFEHTMMVLEEMHERNPNDERALLAALFHDIGKTETPEDVLPHHYKHEVRGVDVADEIAERLKMSREHHGVMKSAARYHGMMRDINDLRESTLLDMVERLHPDYGVSNPRDEPVVPHVTPFELIDLVDADNAGRIPSGEFDCDEAERLVETAISVLNEVSGGDVLETHDIDEGRAVTEVLTQERVREFRRRE